MRILVTFALEDEFGAWRRLRTFRSRNWGTVKVQSAEIEGAEVGILLTGAGPRQASAAAAKAIRNEPESIHCCISTGLAGALRSEYRIGQVLAARTIFPETVPGDCSSRIIGSSEALISFAAECGATVVGRFYSAGRVAGTALEKRHLGASADAVEMESFGVLSQARVSGVPGVAIRAVSDTADEDLPLDMNEIFSEEGQVSIPRVLGQVGRHPHSLPGLLRLAHQSKRAGESLARFLEQYVAVVAERAGALEAKAESMMQ